MIDPAFDIAASGMAAHRAEMDFIASSLAGAGSTGAARTSFVMQPSPALVPAIGGNSISFADTLDVATSITMPANDADGIDGSFTNAGIEPTDFLADTVPTASRSYPDANPIEAMVGLLSANRAYDADVAVLQAAKQIDVEAIDVDRQ